MVKCEGLLFVMEKLSSLQAVKDRFGGLVFLDLTRYDLQTAHRLLGEHARPQVQKILSQKLDRLDAVKCGVLMQQARSCAETLASKLEDKRFDSRLLGAVQEYLDCLNAWAGGVGLADFNHPALTIYKPIRPLDLALFLQHDNTGCQTGMYRQEDESVILWHTEEDVEFELGSGFDQLRLAAFTVEDGNDPITIHAFIYPDLLPGPAFSWRSDGYAQAVDTLHTRLFPDQEAGMLANIATWLTLRLGPDCDPGKVIKDMCPYYDGYALNSACIRGGEIRAEKYEFVADHIFPDVLDMQPGSYLFQANIFSQKEHPWVKELEDIHPADRMRYERRVERTHKALQNKDHQGNETGDMRFFFDLLTSRTGNRWAYANSDVKAYFILRQSTQGAEIWLGYGPAILTDQYSVIHIPPA
jgi:hypothetical protein